ncbi:MAG: hypothetical protein NTY53_22880, partial [Kiritimatiellaeota bacterium]|nr:hypothetical protein [Kiritimatiellota bacterium]
WTEPKTSVRLRLEVRGDGVMGYIDGQPAFSSPMELPNDFELGWVGMANFSADRGKAQSLLERASAGPLAPRLLSLSGSKDEAELDASLAAIRPEINHLSDLAPQWFHIGADSAWQATFGKEEQMLRLFARYYRVRLMPTVTVDPGAQLHADDLISSAAKYKVDGFILVYPVLPNAAWFDALEHALGASNIKILVVAMEPDKGIGRIRGIAAGGDLLSTSAEVTQEAVLQAWTRDGGHKPLSELPPAKPAIMLF